VYKVRSGPLQPRQALWRYFSAKRLIDLLTTGELFFSALSGMSDGLEGALPPATRERLFRESIQRGESAESALLSLESFERHRDQFCVNCWSMNDSESYLMWEAYTARGCGFAIETTHERLAAALERFEGLIEGDVISYVAHNSESLMLPQIGNIYTAITHKDLAYRDEREFRLIYWTKDPKNAAVPVLGKGVRVAVDLDMLVSRIHLRTKKADHDSPSPSRDVVDVDAALMIARLVAGNRMACEVRSTQIVDRS